MTLRCLLHRHPAWSRGLLGFAAVLAGSGLGLKAETVIIQSRVAIHAGDWSYAEDTGNWQNSSAQSSAPGLTGGVGSRFATTDGSAFTVYPVLEAGGTYHVEVTHGTSSNIPLDLMVGIQTVGGSGLPGTTAEFNQLPANAWRRVGTLVLDPGQTTPTITFTKLEGATGPANRFYMDAIRFVNAGDPCLQGPPELKTVNGPLAAGQTFVNVPGVDASATTVTAYADGTAIGSLTSGVVAGLNVVPTSPLVKGTQITTSQAAADGVHSCRPLTGPVVGGGPNPTVRISLSIKEDTTLAGPIGADAGTPSKPLFFLAASGPAAGFGTAPLDGKVIQTGSCWQTVTFLRGEDPLSPADPGYFWANAPAHSELQGDFGILDSIAFCLEDATDSGPYLVYLDNVMNGDVLIQGFEGTAVGTNALFMPPDFSGSTSPFLLAQAPGTISPSVCTVTNVNADTGTNALLVSWQYKDTFAGNWLRLVAQGPGTPNPQIDLRLPIRFRLLLLPVGETEAALSVALAPDQTVVRGGTATFSATATGTGPFTYSWSFQGNPLAGETSSTLSIANVQEANAGTYTVAVSNGACSTSASAELRVVTGPPGPLEVSFHGSAVTLTWPDGAVLQSTSSLSEVFSDVAGATSPFTVDPRIGTGPRFYRLRN